MAVPIGKFKEIATSAEIELVRSSRKPAITNLSATELKKKAAQARKRRDKWQDLSRSQERARSKEVGFGETKANTELKVKAFAEALQNFEAQLAKQGPAPAAKNKAARKTRQARTASHRAARATIREELSAVQESLKGPARKAAKKKAAKQKAVKKSSLRKVATKKAAADDAAAPAESAPKKKVPKRGRPASAPTDNPGLGLDKAKARKATAAAKKRRVDRSGLTSRVRGHVSARGRRAQGKRDSRG